MIDLDRVRADTPGVQGRIHLNAAGASLPPRPVTDTVITHLRDEQLLGGYEAARDAAGRLEGTYHSLARLVGCAADEIALVDNATRAWQQAFYSLSFQPGQRILTSRAEYASNAIPMLQTARRTGVVVEVVEDDEHGQLSIADLTRRIDAGNVALVAVTHVPSQGGLVNPAERIGAVTRRAGIPFLLDACQSVGQVPIDVERIGVDMLSATGRKYLRGPRGTGFLYVRRSLLDQLTPPVLDLHSATWRSPDHYEVQSDSRRFETWEKNVAGLLGLGAAADYALAVGVEEIRCRVGSLADDLRGRLAEQPGIRVHDQGEVRCGIVSFTAADTPAPALWEALGRQGIHVHVSRATSAQFDFDRRGLTELVRASVHYYNTEGEVAKLVESVASRHSRRQLRNR